MSLIKYRKPAKSVDMDALMAPVPPELAQQLLGVADPPREAKPRRAPDFYRADLPWVHKAYAAALPKSLPTMMVALHVARKWMMRKPSDTTITVGNVTLKALGITRHVKGDALRRLEAAGLIRVQHRPRRSPLITVLSA